VRALAALPLVAATCLVAASSAAVRPAESCTSDYKTSARAAAAAYAKQMPKARAAYDRAHRSAQARKAFAKRQAAKLAALKRDADCTVTQDADTGPLPAPAPDANEHVVFSDEMSQSAREEAQGYVTFAIRDEETLLGVPLDESKGIDVFVSTDRAWLAQHECDYQGLAGTCVATTEAHYASSLVDHVGDALFVDWSSNDWSGVNTPLYEKQKIMGNAVFSLFQDQLVGDDGDVGPVWLLAGGAELVGYHVSSDRNLRPYADDLADMRQNIRALTTPLQQIQTWSDYGLVGHWFLAGAADRLVADAPDGIRSLADYYAAIGRGASWQDAFASAFGMSVGAFYADFAAYRQTLAG
jgi:hypothetical protein